MFTERLVYGGRGGSETTGRLLQVGARAKCRQIAIAESEDGGKGCPAQSEDHDVLTLFLSLIHQDGL